MKSMFLDGAAYLQSGAQAENTLADQITRIDREMTTKVCGDFLNFYTADQSLVGIVDSAQFRGGRGIGPFSHLPDISPDAFEAVAARKWRNMMARAAMQAADKEAVIASYEATMPERLARFEAAGMTAAGLEIAA